MIPLTDYERSRSALYIQEWERMGGASAETMSANGYHIGRCGCGRDGCYGFKWTSPKHEGVCDKIWDVPCKITERMVDHPHEEE